MMAPALLSARETSTMIKINDIERRRSMDREPSVWNGMDAQPSGIPATPAASTRLCAFSLDQYVR